MLDTKTATFRGISTETGEWVFGSFIWTGNSYYIFSMVDRPDKYRFTSPHFPSGEEGSLHEVIPDSVGRIVGCFDSSGLMAFEGDIIEIADVRLSQARGVIRFGPNRHNGRSKPTELGFWVDWSSAGTEFWTNELIGFLSCAKIIGNESGVPMPAEAYANFSAETWFLPDTPLSAPHADSPPSALPVFTGDSSESKSDGSSAKKIFSNKCYRCDRLNRRRRDANSIGVCSEYAVVATDSLCGCIQKSDGTVILQNFVPAGV